MAGAPSLFPFLDRTVVFPVYHFGYLVGVVLPFFALLMKVVTGQDASAEGRAGGENEIREQNSPDNGTTAALLRTARTEELGGLRP